jgi:hypothetical protein
MRLDGMARVKTTNYTVEEVLEIMEVQKKLQNKLMVSYQESNSQVTYRQYQDVKKEISWCQEMLEALDPFTYGKTRRTCQSGTGPFSL